MNQLTEPTCTNTHDNFYRVAVVLLLNSLRFKVSVRTHVTF